MRIGLIRHFPVQEDWPTGWRTAEELQSWRMRYESAPATIGEFDVGGVSWQACISSDAPRAIITATTVFDGKAESIALLREVDFATFQTGRLRLPIFGWKWLLRLAWMSGHKSQRACRDGFRQRVRTVADRLENLEHDTLVVSHAGMMAYLSAELRRRGYVGPKLRIAKHAMVYVYEK